MSVEELTFGVGTNLVAAGLLHTGKVTREGLRDTFREAEFSTELDDIETTFAGALKDSVANVEAKRDTGELTGVVERWDPVVRELYGLEEAAEVDGVDRILFESEKEAVEEIAAAIARAAGFDLANTPGLENDLKAAVAVAYRDAIGSFVERIGDTIAEQFLVAASIELHERLHEIRRTVNNLYEKFSRRRYDLHPDDEAGRERVNQKLSRELSGPTDAEVEYVSRPELEDYEGDESLLLLGPGGSGKTRSLVELVRAHEDVAHIIHPREVFQNTHDADQFVMETFEGDVLLVWDDIHEANPKEENAVVRKTIVELRDLLTPEFELHVLATGRIEQKESIPGDPADDDGLWRGVEPVELTGLSPEVLAQVVGAAIDAYDMTVSEAAAGAFHEKALRAEPTPLYVVSVLQNAGDELTEADIEELPESALKIWEKNYGALGENPKRVLRSMKVLGDLAPGSVFPESLLRGVYVKVFDGSDAGFDTPLDTVVDQYWLVESETDDGNVYGMHDVKREAIEQDFERWLVEDLSEFLRASSGRYFDGVSSSTARVLHGNLARRAEEYDRDLTAKHYEYILEHIKGNDAKTRINYGVLLAEDGETERAKERYQQAIDADPDYAEAHANYGFLLLDDSQPGPAVERLETSVRLWLAKGVLRNTLNDMRGLARANSESGKQARAVETGITVLTLASATGVPDKAVNWAWELLDSIAINEPEIAVRLGAVVIAEENFGIGYDLLRRIREREDVDDHLGRVAGVATAAFHALPDVGGDDPDEIVADIDPESLRAPVRAVYDYLTEGETDRTIDDEPSVPEFVPYPYEADDDDRRIEDVPFDELEAAAFDTLLLRLRSETNPR